MDPEGRTRKRIVGRKYKGGGGGSGRFARGKVGYGDMTWREAGEGIRSRG